MVHDLMAFCLIWRPFEKVEGIMGLHNLNFHGTYDTQYYPTQNILETSLICDSCKAYLPLT